MYNSNVQSSVYMRTQLAKVLVHRAGDAQQSLWRSRNHLRVVDGPHLCCCRKSSFWTFSVVIDPTLLLEIKGGNLFKGAEEVQSVGSCRGKAFYVKWRPASSLYQKLGRPCLWVRSMKFLLCHLVLPLFLNLLTFYSKHCSTWKINKSLKCFRLSICPLFFIYQMLAKEEEANWRETESN